MQPSSSPDAPLVAVFLNDDVALAAIRETGAELMEIPAPGVVFLRPAQGLSARLYAAGAGVVVT